MNFLIQKRTKGNGTYSFYQSKFTVKVEKTSENESTKYDFVPDIDAKDLNLAASRREHLDCYISCVP